jgi:ABC-type uncharacterized transport system auxiliary subunit
VRSSALAMVEFEATRALDVTRVPVQVTDTQLAYLQDAVWVDRPARLFGQLVAETIRGSTRPIACTARCAPSAMTRARAKPW